VGDAVAEILGFVLLAILLASNSDGQVSDSVTREEKSDIAKLAQITRADHSTIFFCALTDAGYIRDGKVYSIVLPPGNLRYDNYCFGQAISRDGSRIAYVVPEKTAGGCRIIVRDLQTTVERELARADACSRLITWSWDDSEIAYQGTRAIIAVSVRDGTTRPLGNLPLRINGDIPSEGWDLHGIDWLHSRAEPVLDAEVCIPTNEPGACVNQHQVLLLFQENSQVLEIGDCAAVSPIDDHIALITHNSVWLSTADGSHRRALTTMPKPLFFWRFWHEQPWSHIVWSPNGDHLWFSTIVSDEGATNVYLVDVKSGHRRKILKNSSVTITDWRQSSPLSMR